LHSMIALHSQQLDSLLQAQRGGNASGKWQHARPEAVVACTGGQQLGLSCLLVVPACIPAY
jgi:hypothetical protein